MKAYEISFYITVKGKYLAFGETSEQAMDAAQDWLFDHPETWEDFHHYVDAHDAVEVRDGTTG